MDQIAKINPTSKAALKQQCLYLTSLDIDKAEKMYDFLVKDMEDLPSVDEPQKTFIESFAEQAKSVFAWIQENKDTIGQGLEYIKGILPKRNAAGPSGGALPPIN